jgi:hypothetical protein
MDLKSIVLYLSRNGLLAKDFHLDIEHTLWSDTMGYSTLRLYLCDAPCAAAGPGSRPGPRSRARRLQQGYIGPSVSTSVRRNPGVITVNPRFEVSGAWSFAQLMHFSRGHLLWISPF